MARMRGKSDQQTTTLVSFYPRSDCPARNPVLAANIAAYQRSVRDTYFSDGDSARERRDGRRHLRRICDESLDDLDRDLPLKQEILLELACPSEEALPLELCDDLGRMLTALRARHVDLMPSLRGSWLGRPNPHPPVRQARATLARLIPDRHYDGAIRVHPRGLGLVLPAVFWLTRCSPEVPYVFFSPDRPALGLTVCQYGVVHLTTRHPPTLIRVLREAARAGFRELDRCREQFSETGAIEGRRLVFRKPRKPKRGQ